MLGLAPMYNEVVARHRPQPENQKAFLPRADNLDESSHIIRDQCLHQSTETMGRDAGIHTST